LNHDQQLLELTNSMLSGCADELGAADSAMVLLVQQKAADV